MRYLAVAAATESRSDQLWSLRQVEFHAAWALPTATAVRLQVQIAWSSDIAGHFAIHGRLSDEENAPWVRHASGRIIRADITPNPVSIAASPATSGLLPDQAYALLADHGLNYGPAFRGLREIEFNARHARAIVQLDAATLDRSAGKYRAYPPLLDLVLQTVALALLHAAPGDGLTPIPVRLGQLTLFAALPPEGALTVTLQSGDADLHDSAGRWVGALRGLEFARMHEPRRAALEELLYVPNWIEIRMPQAAATIGVVVVVTHSPATAQPLLAALAAAGVEVSLLRAEQLDSSQGVSQLRATLT